MKQINIKNINLIVTPYQYKKPDISINKDIKILPKLFIEDVYLYTSSEVLTMNANTTDLVVIDDDENFLYAMANFFFNGKNIDTYEDTIRFINNIDSYTKDTIICIDNDLKTAYGVDFAKSLYEKGFKRLFILTGSNKEDIVAPSYITVLNKLHDIHLLKALIS